MLPPATECAPALEALLGAYGDALSAARALPLLSRWPVDVRRESKARKAQRVRRPIARPVVRYYARRRVEKSLAQLVAALDERWLESGIDAGAAERTALRDRLDDQRRKIAPRRPWRVVMDHVPLVPALAGLVIAWLLQRGDDRPSGVDMVAGIALVAVLAWNAAYLLVIVRPFGEHAAQALLAGGESDVGAGAITMRPSVAVDTRESWQGFPKRDTGRLEVEVCRACGLPQLRKYPTDLITSGWHFAGVIGSAVFIAAGLAIDDVGWVLVVFGSVVLGVYLLGLRSFVAVARNRRERRLRLIDTENPPS